MCSVHLCLCMMAVQLIVAIIAIITIIIINNVIMIMITDITHTRRDTYSLPILCVSVEYDDVY